MGPLAEEVSMTFSPTAQKFHGPMKFEIHVEDKRGIPQRPLNEIISIYVDNIHAGDAVLNSFQETRGPNSLHLAVSNFRLLTDRYNDIQVVYKNSHDLSYRKNFKLPTCSMWKERGIASTRPFEVKGSFIDLVESLAQKEKINAGFLAGLIAQESGFNAQAISWAKAIGLTQMTHLAQSEIQDEITNWPQNESITHLPYPVVKGLIALGKINWKNEWRLNKELSVLGGIKYLKYLENQWRAQALWLAPEQQSAETLSRLILASYNSGASRVKRAVKKDPLNWQDDPSLKAAKKYVRMVNSYCYHFTGQ